MLNRMTVTTFLTIVMSWMAAAVIVLLSFNAWDSAEKLRTAGRLHRIAEASANTFKAMHNLRTDRTVTGQILDSEAPLDSNLENYLRTVRENEIVAINTVLELAFSIEIPGQEALPSLLKVHAAAFMAIENESREAIKSSKAARAPGLSKRYAEACSALLEQLDNLSGSLTVLAGRSDIMIDQMLTLTQMARLLRDSGGNATTLVLRSLRDTRPTAEDQQEYVKLKGSVDMAWSSIEAVVKKTEIPKSVTEAVAEAKEGYFDPGYMALRDRLFYAPLKGEKPEMNLNEWGKFASARLATAVTLAERALEAAQQHAVDQFSTAKRHLILQGLLLAGALCLAIVAMLVVRSRVIKPLNTIRDAVIEVAGGNLNVETPYTDRKDEIGALGHALSIFKQNAREKQSLEEQQREQGSRAMRRQQAMEDYIVAFEAKISHALTSLGTSSDQMRESSNGMSLISAQTNAQVQLTEVASGEASLNVQGVAAASEVLSATIGEISRRAADAAEIAGRAVTQAQQTDRTVQGLAQTANRIGEVVGLISSIAAQTNLLALNATIEAARAGESGRGFAVVASEVKSLAAQTARATEEITQQIGAVQKVAEDAVEAIKTIGGTIGQVSQVATAIATAVEEQGSATREISGKTQRAAEGTRKVSESISRVTAAADDTGAAAKNVKAAAEMLGSQTEELRDQVIIFLDQIRAA